METSNRDSDGLVKLLVELLNIPSPTGMCDAAISFVEKELAGIPGLSLTRTRKGALLGRWQGRRDDEARALTAHVDTLGAMVKEIKASGRLKLTQIGGYAWNSVEGEGCTIFSHAGKTIRGSILVNKASVHVHGRATDEAKRDDDGMEVRLDERVHSADDVRKLGIEVGDFIAFDPRVETRNGFVRSRHLDDKACVACIIAAVKTINSSGMQPARTVHLLISNYEEEGHGAAFGIPSDVAEVISVDMAAVGDGQNSDEYHPTLCVKDSGGPYHHGLGSKLRRIAEREKIDYKVDIYPHYGSDGEAFWKAGGDAAVALMGPGVDASHNYERTHIDALLGTIRWLTAYLLGED